MKKFSSILLASAVLLTQAQSITVDWGAADTAALGLVDGSLALQGSLVRLGYFTVSDMQIQTLAAASDKSGLDAAFQEFGTSTVGSGFGIDGVWSASSVHVDTGFSGNSIYYWTLNAPTLSAATEWGIYKFASTYPADTPTPGSITTDLNQVPTNAAGLIVGYFNAAAAPAPLAGADLYKMVAVPEPASSALLLLGLAGLGLRRKRASK